MAADSCLTCSFCGKREEVAGRTIGSSGAHICEDCAAIAARLMHAESSFTDAPISALSRSVIVRVRGLWRHLLTRIRSNRIAEDSFLAGEMDEFSGRVHGPSSENHQLGTY
jgi:ATP-dependent protease Clp ATPase subunit